MTKKELSTEAKRDTARISRLNNQSNESARSMAPVSLSDRTTALFVSDITLPPALDDKAFRNPPKLLYCES